MAEALKETGCPPQWHYDLPKERVGIQFLEVLCDELKKPKKARECKNMSFFAIVVVLAYCSTIKNEENLPTCPSKAFLVATRQIHYFNLGHHC